MNILAIDTSSIYASCAVASNGEILSERTVRNGLVHSKSLMPLVEGALLGAQLTVKDIDLFACVAGPGSFTGVRIGVCAIKGLAQATNKPCVAVNTLDCLCKNVPFAEYVCPILDARRGQVYTAVYNYGKMVSDYMAIPLEELCEMQKGKKTVFLGDGVENYREKLLELMGENCIFADIQHNFTRAASAISLCNLENSVSPAELDAIYLRKPQAEREYNEKHND